ncbi:MAG: tyrosine-type recombinase/integrase [Planctomycetes bacterium]|nr:tyrosine-type recombinase/integrase [Planctomycetota bacterium]
MAFLTRDETHGRPRWLIFWTDATKGAGRAGRRKTVCESGDHAGALDAAGLSGDERAALALGATTRVLRDRLVKCYDLLERERARDAAHAGGPRSGRFETPLSEFLRAYLDLLAYRVALDRGESPQAPADLGWRPRLATKPARPLTLDKVRRVLDRVLDWLPPGTTTGALDAELVNSFLSHVEARVRARGARCAPATLNKFRSVLRAALLALTPSAARRYFRANLRDLFAEVEAMAESPRDVELYTPAALAAFLAAAEAIADPDRPREVARTRGARSESFTQRATPTVPVFSLALVLACLGLRRAEALALRWADANFDTGLVRIRATKTGRARYLPLVGDPAGDVAPRFLDLLRAWRAADPGAEYVLPLAARERFPSSSWNYVREKAGLDQFGPQGIRRTFESALAALGVPAPLAALWLGHAPAVAHKHYLAYSPGRLPGRTVEEVLGLAPFLARALERARKNTPFRLVASAHS